MNRLQLGCVALLAFFVFAAPPANAHAKLIQAVPAAGAKLAETPKELALSFNEAVEPSLTVIELDDANGTVIATSQGLNACGGTTCHLALPALKAGNYKVKFHAHSADGHLVNGGYDFSLGN